MRKALAQNPNLLRTLMGLSFTLVFVLSYAVYGATIDTQYHLYSTDRVQSESNLTLLEHTVIADDDGDEVTVWLWQADVDRQNLTWVNASIRSAPSGSSLTVINNAGWYSHPSLAERAEDISFNCATECQKESSHTVEVNEDGDAVLVGLIHTDPARRDGGTVRADSEEEALSRAHAAINHTYDEGVWQVRISAPGNHSIAPDLTLEHVNEEFASMEPFSLDAATELMWGLAAVIGCFLMLLIPLLLVFLFSRLAEKDQPSMTIDSSEE